MPERKVRVLDRQTIWDVAIQEYGSVEGVFALLADNPGKEINTPLVAGELLKIKTVPVDEEVVTHFASKSIHPITGPIYVPPPPDPCAAYLAEPPRLTVDYVWTADVFDAFESLVPDGAQVVIVDRETTGGPTATFGDDHIGYHLTKTAGVWDGPLLDAGTVVEDASLLASEPWEYQWLIHNPHIPFSYPTERMGLSWLPGWAYINPTAPGAYPGVSSSEVRIQQGSIWTGVDVADSELSMCRKPQLQYFIDGEWTNIPVEWEKPPSWVGTGFWIASLEVDRTWDARIEWRVGAHIQGYSAVTPP